MYHQNYKISDFIVVKNHNIEELKRFTIYWNS